MKPNHSYLWKSILALALAVASTSALRAAIPVVTVTNPPLPYIQVFASDPVALAGTSSASFTLLRYGPTNSAVSVNLGISGTASNGIDYGPITNSVTIPAGTLALDIPIVPITPVTKHGNKSVVLTVQSNAAYRLYRSKASVQIIDDVYNIPAPTVTVTSPVDGSSYTNPSVVTITATVSDPDIPVTSVSLYANDILIGKLTNSPYSLTVTNPHPGHYAIFARAVDSVDHSAVSAPVHITVVTPTPKISFITPTNGSKFPAGTNITLTANATEVGGAIASVVYHAGTVILGKATNSPYSLTWTNVPKGSYDLYAVATDTTGTMAYTEIDITVTNVPVVTNIVTTSIKLPPPPKR